MPSSQLSSLLVATFVGICLLALVLLVRTFANAPDPLREAPCTIKDADYIKADDEMIGRFQKVVRIRTVSRSSTDQNYEALQEMVNFLEKEFDFLHSHPLVSFEKVNNYSMLYFIKGRKEQLKPYMLAAHLDVVPVEGQHWTVPTFEGLIKDGYLYGRGTMDDKMALLGILEAISYRLKLGQQPTRSLYIAFGHDEEVIGWNGAFPMGEILRKRGIQLEYLMDEGMTVTDGVYPGIKTPVATIAVSEKGMAMVKLSAECEPGHSSMPPQESCIGIMAKAVSRLEDNPQPSMLGTGPEVDTFKALAPEMNFVPRMALSNLWLFNSIISRMLSKTKTSNSLIRTTTVATIFNAGIKDNVLPSSVQTVINHRIHPSQTVKQVIDYDRKIIGDDRINIKLDTNFEAHPISPSDDKAFGYNTIKTSIRQVFSKDKGVLVVPGVLMGNTDTKHYLHLTKNIYRFTPTYLFPEDISRFHGVDERVSLKNFEQAINFYYHLMLNSDKETIEEPHSHHSDL